MTFFVTFHSGRPLWQYIGSPMDLIRHTRMLHPSLRGTKNAAFSHCPCGSPSPDPGNTAPLSHYVFSPEPDNLLTSLAPVA